MSEDEKSWERFLKGKQGFTPTDTDKFNWFNAKLSEIQKENEELEKKRLENWKMVLALWDAIDPKPEDYMCRDCADADIQGICNTDGLPCDPQQRALKIVSQLQSTIIEKEKEWELQCKLKEEYMKKYSEASNQIAEQERTIENLEAEIKRLKEYIGKAFIDGQNSIGNTIKW